MRHNRCDNDTCGRAFGLVRQRWMGYAFCSTACRSNFLAMRAKQIDRVKSWLAELVAYSKSKEGGVSFASAGVGTTTHLAPELLKLQGGLVGTHVPYRGAGPSMPDVLTGRIQAVFYSPAAVQPYIDDNRVRAIAQTGVSRSQTNPNVPTGIESGFPNFRVDLWTAVFVPNATPKAIVDRLSAEIRNVVEDAAFKSAMAQIGAEPFYYGPDEAAAFVRTDFEKWAELSDAQISS
jgi:tripartite-type tricarboxylate transporter receptor subunit TctC